MNTKLNADPAGFDDSDRKLIADVKSFGWHLVGVPEDEHGPAFCFTVGLYLHFQHPEIVVTGLEMQTMACLLNDAGHLVKTGTALKAGTRSLELVEGLPVEFRALHVSHYRDFLGMAMWFYLGSNFPSVQCVWPDKAGCFPWDPSFDSRFFALQPALWTPSTGAQRH